MAFNVQRNKKNKETCSTRVQKKTGAAEPEKPNKKNGPFKLRGHVEIKDEWGKEKEKEEEYLVIILGGN